jgi:hypothetical protein
MKNALGPRVVLVTAVVLAAVFVGRDSLLAQSRTFTSGVELVSLAVTVTDRAGRYLRDLTAADFAIFEEGRRQAISQFASVDVPIDMAVVLDTSDSMRKPSRLRKKPLADSSDRSTKAIGGPSRKSGRAFPSLSRSHRI